MQSAYFKKLTVFLVLMFIFMGAQTVIAQTSLTELEQLRNGTLSTSQFVEMINKNPNVPVGQYHGIVARIKVIDNSSISDEGLNNLLKSVKDDFHDIYDVSRIYRFAGNLKDNAYDADLTNGILKNLNEGKLSPRFALTFTNITQNPEMIGELKKVMETFESIEGITDDFTDDIFHGLIFDGIRGPDVAKSLEDLKKYSDFIKDAANIVQDPEILKNLAKKFADGGIPIELADTIKDALPNIDEYKDLFSVKEMFLKLGVTDALKEFESPQELLETLAGLAEFRKITKGWDEISISGFVKGIPKEAMDKLLEEFGDIKGVIEALMELVEGGVDNNIYGKKEEKTCGPECKSCEKCAPEINKNHLRIRSHFTSQMQQHRTWLISTFFLEYVADAMGLMTSQIVTLGSQQVQTIGQFFDAKHQLEMQRLFQTMTAKAHSQTHPSVGLCEIGTNTQALASSNRLSNFSHNVMATRMMDRQLSNGDSVSGGGEKQDRESRINLFITKFCNKTDHAGALTKLCKDSNPDPEQVNMDIDYTNAIDTKLTLEVDPLKPIYENPSQDEENLFAISSNLFGNKVLPKISDARLMQNGNPTNNVQYLLDIRALAAKRSVAQNSFAAITSLKTQSNGQGAPFLKAFLKETGITDPEIEKKLGEKPSYYAQMEMLTKTIYQNPSFYANLYDNPVNVERKGVALLALELMQDRDIYESLLRSEAVLATMIEVLLRDEQTRVQEELLNVSTSTSIQSSGGP